MSKLWYCIVNCGDGSASLRLFSSEARARFFESREYEPFAESSVSCIDFKNVVYLSDDEEIDPEIREWNGKGYITIPYPE